MRKPLQPFRTLTPWTGFGPRDQKRPKPLPVCPSAACRRAKQCIRATDGHFCQRTHLTPAEARAQRKPARVKKLPVLGARPSQKKIEAYRIMTDHLVAEFEAHARLMTERWKRGELDALYGAYDPKGVVLVPPPCVYVDERRKRLRNRAASSRRQR